MSVLRIKDFLKSNTAAFGLLVFVVLTVSVMREEAVEIFRYWTGLIGPTAYVFFPMGVILVGAILLIAIGKMDGRFPFSAGMLHRIEEAAPIVGLLGTVVALTSGFNELDSTRTEDIPIEAVIRILSESLYSTAVGLTIGLSSWAVRTGLTPEKPTGGPQRMERPADRVEGLKRDEGTEGIQKGSIILPLLIVLTVLSLLSAAYAEESTYEIEGHPSVVSVDHLQTTMVRFLDKKGQRYLREVLRVSKGLKQRGNAPDGQGALSPGYSRERYLNILLRMEEIKGQVWYRGAGGALYVYPVQMQGIRRILYILILTDDGRLSGSLMDTYENRIFSLRYSTLILTSDNIIRLSRPVAERYVTEYIPVEAEEMFTKLVRDMEGISEGAYGDGGLLKTTNVRDGGWHVPHTPDVY